MVMQVAKQRINSSRGPQAPCRLLRGELILGIDPGSHNTGFGVLQTRQDDAVLPGHFQIVDAGLIRAPASQSFLKRMQMIHGALVDLISDIRPQYLAIEMAFTGINSQTALKLGEARGIIMAAAMARAIPIFQITPAQVKKFITGNGAASKLDVEAALGALIGYRPDAKISAPDVSDALAIALTFGMQSRMF